MTPRDQQITAYVIKARIAPIAKPDEPYQPEHEHQPPAPAPLGLHCSNECDRRRHKRQQRPANDDQRCTRLLRFEFIALCEAARIADVAGAGSPIS